MLPLRRVGSGLTSWSEKEEGCKRTAHGPATAAGARIPPQLRAARVLQGSDKSWLTADVAVRLRLARSARHILA